MDEDKPPTEDLDSTETARPQSPIRPVRIGNYRILQKIGEGGMGEVYEAEQERPIRRRVALKIIKPGMDSRRVLARFEVERQALALMNHPNVAKVFDAGATPLGRPYIAMEYVHGLPITEHCDRRRLSTRGRLELFQQVCAGVQHAHQKGIIHRDIKPSNVLVQVQDADRVPKIIDFGVAKATQQRLTERTLYTELGQLIGTPEYMSPEQAEITAEDVDTRTDVYSLGVLLYELLVGALPFDPVELRRKGFDEIRRKIREDEPSRPSTRISALGEAAKTSARNRRADLPTLRRQLRGDLDWITMKALEKDRARRYGSPQELAADIERYISHEPVLASPPSTAYRTAKFVRRHRLGVSVAAGLLVLLLGFGISISVLYTRAVRAERAMAMEARTAQRALDFMTGMFEVSDPSEARGNTITAREILETGAEKIDRELTDQPRIQARLMDTIGWVYQGLGLYRQAESLLQNALRIRRLEFGNDHLEVADSLAHLGWLRVNHGAASEALTLQREALRIREEFLGLDHIDTGWSLYYVGNALALSDDRAEAEAHYRRALAIFEREPDERGLSWCLNDLGMLHKQAGDYAAAVSFFGRALEVLERTLPSDHPDLAVPMANMALIFARRGNFREAESYYTRAKNISVSARGRDHPFVAWLAACYFAQIGEHAEAVRHLRLAVDRGFVSQQVVWDKDLAPLRGDPEFEAIVAEVKKRLGEE